MKNDETSGQIGGFLIPAIWGSAALKRGQYLLPRISRIFTNFLIPIRINLRNL